MHSRRAFLKSGGLAAFSFGLMPGFLQRAVAATPGRSRGVLVTIFLRGGADGLSVIPPVGDPDYYALRPSVAIKPPGQPGGALALDGNFGLHPALEAIYPLWQSRQLAVLHAVGQPNPTRSHFDAQDFMEAGLPGERAADGWMNRALQGTPEGSPSAFRAVALQPRLPRSLWGPSPALSIGTIDDLQIRAGGLSKMATVSFESLYAGAVDEALRHTGDEAFGALHEVTDRQLAKLPPQNGAVYPKSPLSRRLQDIARLIHADVGLEAAATESGGWDTHVAQGAEQGQLANRLKELAEALAAFATDLGPKLFDVCVVVMTEFGRTAHENGNRGTDHGTASFMLTLGGGVHGGRVLSSWPGLKAPQLFEGRDLAMTTDYRAPLAETVSRMLAPSDPTRVFPGFAAAPVGLFG